MLQEFSNDTTRICKTIYRHPICLSCNQKIIIGMMEIIVKIILKDLSKTTQIENSGGNFVCL